MIHTQHKKNPFDISFGRIPNQSVARFLQTNEILETFTSEPTTHQVYMITGVRGSGKTVLMNSIANSLEEDGGWIVARLNPGQNLVRALGARLCGNPECLEFFRHAQMNLSLFGISMGFNTEPTITDDSTTVEQMLGILRSKGKKVLVTLDEVTNNEHIRLFANEFQILIGQNMPIFLLMTGLYENIDALQNEKNLTFLYRAPKIWMTPLNLRAIASRYASVFEIDPEQALRMARQTEGYSFAFQALGYSAWRNGTGEESYMTEYLQLLWDFVYEKMWTGLSEKEKKVMIGLAHSPEGTIGEVNDYLGLKPNEINQYRKRLIRKGIVISERRGHLAFSLPFFRLFVLDQDIEQ